MPLMSADTTNELTASVDDANDYLQLEPEARAYYDAVAARLTNIDPSERHELLSDLAEHLTELSGEPGIDLTSATTFDPLEEPNGADGIGFTESTISDPTNDVSTQTTMAEFDPATDG